jgi:hypothetical protein
VKNLNISIAFALVLVGCASPADYRKTTPDLSLSSKKSPLEISTCAGDRSTEIFPTGFTTRTTSNGYSLVGLGGGVVYFLVDIEGKPGGSTTKYWSGTAAVASVYREFMAIVQICQS